MRNRPLGADRSRKPRSLKEHSSVVPPPATLIAEQAGPIRRTFYPFLDGLRGLAALIVVIHHADLAFSRKYGHLAARGARTLWLELAAHFAVSTFIVLSGYCLMLPVAANGNALRGGVRGFIARRARRILPPYYAAYFLSLGVAWLLPALGGGRATTIPGIVSHLLVVHNANVVWIYQTNGALWSVATEWQIYFVFALLLLPLARRIGAGRAVAIAVVLSALPYAISPHFRHWERACPWYVGLFALGMAAATIPTATPRGRWPLIAAVFGATS